MSLTFKSKTEAWRAIIDASGMDGYDYSKADQRFELYQHCRGPKPDPWDGGELDGVNDEVNCRVSGPMEAFFLLTPTTRRWADVIHAVQRLREVPGLEQLRIPDDVVYALEAEIHYWHHVELSLTGSAGGVPF